MQHSREMPAKFKAWHEKARAFAPLDNWAEFKRGTDEHKAWVRYFLPLGWSPWGLRMLNQNKIQVIIMPAQWPEWFDSDYQPRAGADLDRAVDAEIYGEVDEAKPFRLTYAELNAKYGDGKGGWGVNGVADKPRWSPPTADEMRKICGDDTWQRIKATQPSR